MVQCVKGIQTPCRLLDNDVEIMIYDVAGFDTNNLNRCPKPVKILKNDFGSSGQ